VRGFYLLFQALSLHGAVCRVPFKGCALYRTAGYEITENMHENRIKLTFLLLASLLAWDTDKRRCS
jgi:hypothetical protein